MTLPGRIADPIDFFSKPVGIQYRSVKLRRGITGVTRPQHLPELCVVVEPSPELVERHILWSAFAIIDHACEPRVLSPPIGSHLGQPSNESDDARCRSEGAGGRTGSENDGSHLAKSGNTNTRLPTARVQAGEFAIGYKSALLESEKARAPQPEAQLLGGPPRRSSRAETLVGALATLAWTLSGSLGLPVRDRVRPASEP